MSTAAAANPMGLKRICTNCGARFYDMNKRPIVCPTCDTEFTGEVKVKGRRGRAAADPKKVDPVKAASQPTSVNEDEDNDLLEEDDDGVEVVSLDDADDVTSSKNNKGDDENDEDEDDPLSDIPDLEDDPDDLGSDDDNTLLDEDDD